MGSAGRSASANRAGRSVSFAGGAKAGAISGENATNLKAIHAERVAWQKVQVQRFLELPQINPTEHDVSQP